MMIASSLANGVSHIKLSTCHRRTRNSLKPTLSVIYKTSPSSKLNSSFCKTTTEALNQKLLKSFVKHDKRFLANLFPVFVPSFKQTQSFIPVGLRICRGHEPLVLALNKKERCLIKNTLNKSEEKELTWSIWWRRGRTSWSGHFVFLPGQDM